MPNKRCRHKWMTIAEYDHEENVIRSDLLCEHLEPRLANDLVTEVAICRRCGTLRLRITVDCGEDEACDLITKYLPREQPDA